MKIRKQKDKIEDGDRKDIITRIILAASIAWPG